MAELQHKLNSQAHKIFAVKVSVLIMKEWDPENWHGDIWAIHDEVGDMALNF